MTGKEPGVIFCNHKSAAELMEKHPDCVNSIVITELLSDGAGVVVNKLDFVNWLCQKNDEFLEYFERSKENKK